MESITLDKKDKMTPEASPELKYTLIVKGGNKYPKVYSGCCCKHRIKKFVKTRKCKTTCVIL